MKHISLAVACLGIVSGLVACADVDGTPTGEDAPVVAEGESGLTVAERLGLSYGGQFKVGVSPIFSSASGALTRKDPAACSVSNLGTCQLTTCGKGQLMAPDDGDAGDVTITGGVTPVTLKPAAGGRYSRFFTPPGTAPNFRDGDILSLDAAGGSAARAFSVSGLRMPTAIKVGLPADTNGNLLPVTIDATRDFDIPWTTQGASVVEVVLQSLEGRYMPTTEAAGVTFDPERRVTLSCVLPAALGHGVLPASALRAFAKGTTVNLGDLTGEGVARTGTLQVFAQNRKIAIVRRPAGGWRVVDVIAEKIGKGTQVQQLTFL